MNTRSFRHTMWTHGRAERFALPALHVEGYEGVLCLHGM